MKLFVGLLFLTLTLTGSQADTLAHQGALSRAAEYLQSKIEPPLDHGPWYVAGKKIYSVEALLRFYRARNFEPAWFLRDKIADHSITLLAVLTVADHHGLNPEIYHISAINEMLEAFKKTGQNGIDADFNILANIDLLMTDAFLTYGSHLLAGRVNPETFDTDWIVNRRVADMAEVLEDALDSGSIYESLRSLWPKHDGYIHLHETYNLYRLLLENGFKWPLVPPGPNMREGDRNDRVAMLRARLADEPELQGEFLAGETDLFDNSLKLAVVDFQSRHGLDTDGVVGPATLSALNTSLEDKVKKIRLNLERWRWLPEDLGPASVQVNIANFHLRVVEQGQTVLEMPIIVGKDYRQTPVFSDNISYMVLNPSWYIPQSIAVDDKLPLIRKNPGYLSQQKIRVFSSWKADAKEINPNQIDWKQVTESNFYYKLRQDPGPNNALGRIKFMFPNRFNVYLHDTPSRQLFNKTSRTFSSGCIRIQKPEQLALYLLKDDPRWDWQALRKALDTNKEQTIRLPKPVPVHLLYWTVFVDDDGVVQFRNDIYGRDAQLAKALDAHLGR